MGTPSKNIVGILKTTKTKRDNSKKKVRINNKLALIADRADEQFELLTPDSHHHAVMSKLKATITDDEIIAIYGERLKSYYLNQLRRHYTRPAVRSKPFEFRLAYINKSSITRMLVHFYTEDNNAQIKQQIVDSDPKYFKVGGAIDEERVNKVFLIVKQKLSYKLPKYVYLVIDNNYCQHFIDKILLDLKSNRVVDNFIDSQFAQIIGVLARENITEADLSPAACRNYQNSYFYETGNNKHVLILKEEFKNYLYNSIDSSTASYGMLKQQVNNYWQDGGTYKTNEAILFADYLIDSDFIDCNDEQAYADNKKYYLDHFYNWKQEKCDNKKSNSVFSQFYDYLLSEVLGKCHVSKRKQLAQPSPLNTGTELRESTSRKVVATALSWLSSEQPPEELKTIDTKRIFTVTPGN